MALSRTIFEIFDVEQHHDLEILVRGHLLCKFMHNLYITEIYGPGAIIAPLTVCIYLHSILHSKLQNESLYATSY